MKCNDTIRDSEAQTDDSFTLIPERVLTEPAGPKTEWWRPKFETPDEEVLAAVDLSSPIYIPTRDSLAIGLIPADTVYRLEEYRSDQMRWEAIMWVFVGAVFGIIVNWITSDPIVVSRTSIIVAVIFVVVTGIIWFAARDYKRRAEVMKSRILEFRKSSQPFTKNPK